VGRANPNFQSSDGPQLILDEREYSVENKCIHRCVEVGEVLEGVWKDLASHYEVFSMHTNKWKKVYPLHCAKLIVPASELSHAGTSWGTKLKEESTPLYVSVVIRFHVIHWCYLECVSC
jgi:hypothetical protein